MDNAGEARRIVADARNILGGNGILYRYHVARHWAAIEAVRTYEDTDSIDSLMVGRQITALRVFSQEAGKTTVLPAREQVSCIRSVEER